MGFRSLEKSSIDSEGNYVAEIEPETTDHLDTTPSPEIATSELARKAEYQELFSPWSGTSFETMVCQEDKILGKTFKTYIMPLDAKFHKAAYEEYDEGDYADFKRGCLLEACPSEYLNGLFPQYPDYNAEVPILRKMLGALTFVPSEAEADLILIPALPVTKTSNHWKSRKPNLDDVGGWLGCRNYGLCEEE